MSRNQIDGEQIQDETVKAVDLDIIDVSSNILDKIIVAGDGTLSISSVNLATGEVTITGNSSGGGSSATESGWYNVASGDTAIVNLNKVAIVAKFEKQTGCIKHTGFIKGVA